MDPIYTDPSISTTSPSSPSTTAASALPPLTALPTSSMPPSSSGKFTTLLDALKNPIYGKPAQQGQTQQISGVARAASGRETSANSGGVSTVNYQPENAAAQEANATTAQLNQAAAGEQQTLLSSQSDIQTQQRLATQQLADKRSNAIQEYSDNVNSLLSDYLNQNKSIQTMDDVNKMEYAGAVIRLQGQEYIDNLNRIGGLQRITDSANFQVAIAQDVFQNEETLFKNDADFKTLLNADDRTFQRALENMDIDYAIQIARKQQAIESTRAAGAAAGGVINAGAKYMDAFNSKPDNSGEAQ